MNKKVSWSNLTMIILVVGIFLRFVIAINSHVSGDACWHLSVGRFIGEEHHIPLFEGLGRDSVFSRPPFFHVLAGVFYKIFGVFGMESAELGMRLISPLFGGLLLLLFYCITREFFDARTTFVAVSILAFLPLQLDYGSISYLESTLSFFALLSVYFMVKRRVVLSAVMVGIVVLSKYEGVFMIPVLLLILWWNNRKNVDKVIKKAAVFLTISTIIFSPLFIRNYLNLGNPVWPYLGQFIEGYPIIDQGYLSADIKNLFQSKAITMPYLELFGVPNGSIKAFFFFDIPFIEILLVLWVSATLFYFLFFALGVTKVSKKKPEQVFLVLWMATFALLIIATTIVQGQPATRYFMTATPAMAILWALGIVYAFDRSSTKIKGVLILFFVIINIGFVGSILGKGVLAGKSWEPFEKDFQWIKKNTGEKSILFYNGQCLAYNTARFTTPPLIPKTGYFTVPEKAKDFEEAYIWINQHFKLETQSVLPKEVVEVIEEEYNVVYSNEETQTKIYKVD